MIKTKEETLKELEDLFKEFNPAWNFLIPAIKKIAEEYYDKQEDKCKVQITEKERELYQLALATSLDIIRDVLNDVNIKCHLMFIKDTILNVSFGR